MKIMTLTVPSFISIFVISFFMASLLFFVLYKSFHSLLPSDWTSSFDIQLLYLERVNINLGRFLRFWRRLFCCNLIGPLELYFIVWSWILFYVFQFSNLLVTALPPLFCNSLPEWTCKPGLCYCKTILSGEKLVKFIKGEATDIESTEVKYSFTCSRVPLNYKFNFLPKFE